MNKETKNNPTYKTIGMIAKELGLVDKKTGRLQTHTLRYWEKEFKQISPSIRAGKRRYYSEKDFKIIKKIKFLLKERGFTISGVKKMLSSSETLSLDDNSNLSLYDAKFKSNKIINEKVKKISNIIKELKNLK